MGVDIQNNRMIFTGDSANQPVNLWFGYLHLPLTWVTQSADNIQHPPLRRLCLRLHLRDYPNPHPPKSHLSPIRTNTHRRPNRRRTNAETLLANEDHNRDTRFHQPED